MLRLETWTQSNSLIALIRFVWQFHLRYMALAENEEIIKGPMGMTMFTSILIV